MYLKNEFKNTTIIKHNFLASCSTPVGQFIVILALRAHQSSKIQNQKHDFQEAV